MLASRTLELSTSWIICVFPFTLVGRLDWLEGVWVRQGVSCQAPSSQTHSWPPRLHGSLTAHSLLTLLVCMFLITPTRQ